MLHTLTKDGHMAWACPCGRERTAHISDPAVQHPTSDEMETVVEGTTIDDQGRTWTRHLSRPTGKKIIHGSHIALPACECGKQTFLAVPTDEHYATAASVTGDGTPTTASMEAFNRTQELARQMKSIGKGPATDG